MVLQERVGRNMSGEALYELWSDVVEPKLVGQRSHTGFLENIVRDALGDPLRRHMDGVLRQMGVAGRGLDVAVAKQLADHRLGLAERQGTGREGMSQVVQPVDRRGCLTPIGTVNY